MGSKLSDVDFAVIDFETTGLSPHRHDRVIEVAIVRLVAGGRLSEEYESLVNPGRDLGPTQIHRISAKDILDVPTFEEIIGDILGRLANAVVVAHNIQFDKAFLIAECRWRDTLSLISQRYARCDCLQFSAVQRRVRAARLLRALWGRFGEQPRCRRRRQGMRSCWPSAWRSLQPRGSKRSMNCSAQRRRSQPPGRGSRHRGNR